MAILAETDFFTVEILTLRRLATYYVLFFIHLENRKVEIAGFTPHANERWMKQIARNVTIDEWGFIRNCRDIHTQVKNGAGPMRLHRPHADLQLGLAAGHYGGFRQIRHPYETVL